MYCLTHCHSHHQHRHDHIKSHHCHHWWLLAWFLSTPVFGAWATYSSMALFHMMTYPDKMKDSMLTMCVFPRSVPTYSHLLWKGRWQNVILENKKQKEERDWVLVYEQSQRIVLAVHVSGSTIYSRTLYSTYTHWSMPVAVHLWILCRILLSDKPCAFQTANDYD